MPRFHRPKPPDRGQVLAFAPRRRPSDRGWGGAARSLGPIGLAQPLAAFMAVFVWRGPPPAGAVALPAVAERTHTPRTAETTPAMVDAAQPRPSVIRRSGSAASPSDRESARFGPCYGRSGDNCTIDGDSIIYAGRQIRIADIDTPEIGHPTCPGERALGQAAEDRLRDLLNAGSFSLEPADRTHDRYGRELWTITRGGRSLGETLIAEGLAHPWVGHKLPWC